MKITKILKIAIRMKVSEWNLDIEGEDNKADFMNSRLKGETTDHYVDRFIQYLHQNGNRR